MPIYGLYLYNWFWDMSETVTRIVEGNCVPIAPTEFLAWSTMSGNLVHPWEYVILKAMDTAYCEIRNSELADARKRWEEKQLNK